MQSYAYITKWRKIQVEIERYWESGATRWDNLAEAIKKYDCGNRIPLTYRKMVSAQIQGGFTVILAIPVTLLMNEIFLSEGRISNDYAYPLVLLLAYVIWEIILFAYIRPMKKPEE